MNAHQDPGRKPPLPEGAPRRRALPLLLAALLIGLSWLLLRGGGSSALSAPTRALDQIETELFGAPPACSSENEVARRRLAEQAEARARARAERYVFDPISGPWAVHLWGEAHACWTLVGDADRARSASSEQDLWRARVLRDLRGHQLRLERAKQRKQSTEALGEVNALVSLFEGGPGRAAGRPGEPRYLDWLLREQRLLQRP